MLPIPLQTGDLGIRSVESVALSGATATGTAGNFGVTLFKPLLPLCYFNESQDMHISDAVRNRGGYLPKVETDACLWFVDSCGGGSAGNLFGELIFVEG